MPYTYNYPRPALTVDIVVFGLAEDGLSVLLIQRDLEPYASQWALPGGFVHVDETLETAAQRELEEETGLRDIFLEQLHTFGAVDRDPRERVVTVAYYSLVNLEGHEVKASSDARNAAWFAMTDLPSLAFDHDDVLAAAHERLRGKVRYQPIGFDLLPPVFPICRLQHLYEVILGRELDRRDFSEKILSTGILVELDEVEKDVAHRAARLYRFDKEKHDRLAKDGFNFEV